MEERIQGVGDVYDSFDTLIAQRVRYRVVISHPSTGGLGRVSAAIRLHADIARHHIAEGPNPKRLSLRVRDGRIVDFYVTSIDRLSGKVGIRAIAIR